MTSRLKPALFVAFADPEDTPGAALPSLRQEEANIRAALSDVCELGSWDYLSGLDCTRSGLVNQFKSDRIAAFHFGGHASPQSLLLPAETQGNQIVSGILLDEFLAQQTSLKLAFFNACSTQQWAAKLSERIPYVIATVCSVDDRIASQFSSAFYSALAADKTVEDAFAWASAAVALEHEVLKPIANVAETDSILGRPQFRRMETEDDDLASSPTFPWILCKNGKATADDERWTFSVAARDPLVGLSLLDDASYPLPDSPYVSIKGHTEADAPLFFGRSAEIRELYDWALSETNVAPVLLFHGQSGSGKSSLLDAGLRPRLKKKRTVEYRRRSLNLIDDLNAAIGGASDAHIEAWLNANEPKLIILDQVEEAITHNAGSSDEIHALVQCIQSIFSRRGPASKARLILSFRKEYLAEIQGSFARIAPEAASPLVETLWLDRLDHDGIVQVVEGPTLKRALRDKYGITLEDGFSEFVASRLTDPSSPIATILQILLNQLWQKANENAPQNGGRILYTQALWCELSALDNPLHGFYADQLESLFTEAGNNYRQGLELDLLLEHTTDLGTSQRRTFEELVLKYPQIPQPELQELIRRNKDRYLLTDPPARQADISEPATGSTDATVLSHDTLAPVIRRDYALSVEPGAKARRLVENRAREWVDGKTGGPLDAFDLRVVSKGFRHMRALQNDEQRMLHHSRKRARRLLATIVSAFVVLVSIPSTIGYMNWRAQNALRLAGEAKDATASHYDLAVLLSIAAYKISPARFEVRDAIASVYEARPEAIAFLHPLHPQTYVWGGMAFSTDGRLLAVTSGNQAELWDVRHRTRLWSVQTDNDSPYVAISPDGKYLAVADSSSVQIWNTSSGTSVRRALERAPQNMSSLAFSGSRLIASGCTSIQAWRVEQWKPLLTVPSPDPGCMAEDKLTNIAVNPANPTEIASRSFHGRVTTGTTVLRQSDETKRDADDGLYLLSYSADGNRLVATTRWGGLEVFDLRTRRSLGVLPEQSFERFGGVGLNRDGSRLTAMRNGALGEWDTQTMQPVRPLLEGRWAGLKEAVISPDFNTVAMRGSDGDVLLLDNNWGVGAVPLPGPEDPNQVKDAGPIAFSPDGKWIASGTTDGSVFLWNAASRELVSKFSPTGDRPLIVDSLAFSPDSQVLAWPVAGSVQDARIGVHRVQLPAARRLPDLVAPLDKGEMSLQAITFAPDGSLVGLSDQGVLRIWSSHAGDPPRVFRGKSFGGLSMGLAATADSKYLAIPGTSGHVLAMLNLETGQPLQPDINLQGMPAYTIDISPASHGKNQSLVAEGHPYGISIWNYLTGKPVGSADMGQTVVRSVKFSPDGKLLAVGLDNGELRIWDVSAARWLGADLMRAGDSGTDFGPRAVFSPDSKRIVWGGPHGSLRQWDWTLDFDSWVDKACAIAGRNMTRQEWSLHYPYMPYEKLCPNLPDNPEPLPAK